MEEREDTRAMAIAASVLNSTPIQETKTEIDDVLKTDKFSTAPISNVNAGKENIIDSKNLSKKIRILMKSIKNEKTSPEGKIKIAEFICNKLYDIYILPENKQNIIIREMKNTIFNSENMLIPLRLYYLKFRNESISYPVSVQLFREGVRDKIRLVPYFQILKYILRSNILVRKEQDCSEVLDEFDQLFNNPEVSIYTKMEIADIFLINDRIERGNEMLNTLRELEVNLIQNPIDNNITINQELIQTVYNDSQNVHSSNLNESVLKACVSLMEIEHPSGFNSEKVKLILQKISPEYKDIIDTVLERIEIDTSRFKWKDNIFGLHDVFSSLWKYINKHTSSDELYKRLIEEMVAMTKYCTTGHISRFINVIQGYTDDEKLFVRISDEQQIRAVIGHYLDTMLMNADDDIADSMIGTNQEPFYNFISNSMNNRIPQLLEEYGEVKDYIISVVKSYTKWDYWEITDKTIKWCKKSS